MSLFQLTLYAVCPLKPLWTLAYLKDTREPADTSTSTECQALAFGSNGGTCTLPDAVVRRRMGRSLPPELGGGGGNGGGGGGGG